MFVQFFREPACKVRVVAWLGLAVVLAYSAFAAYIKSLLNEFYNDFYDLMQVSGTLLVQSQGDDAGSGGNGGVDESTSGDQLTELSALRGRVYKQLVSFGYIVAPLVFASPMAKWVRSEWSFAWRVALMRSYLSAWDVHVDVIEGAAQRLHEDTQRFCNALQGCLAIVLDALFTLAVFAPILVDLGNKVPPPIELGALRSGWLLVAAYLAASVSLFGAFIVGKHLVQLEVENQRTEAGLRRDLVILEASPASLLGDAASVAAYNRPSSPALQGRGLHQPLLFFNLTLKRLAENYHRLFRNFAALNLWLSFFDQVLVIAPYAFAAPLLFADNPEDRITLGVLVKLTNSFDRVFGSLSIISENWGSVNEFRSVVQRLREFERRLYANRRPAPSLPPPSSRQITQLDIDPPPPSPKCHRRRNIVSMLLSGTSVSRARLVSPPETPPLASSPEAAPEAAPATSATSATSATPEPRAAARGTGLQLSSPPALRPGANRPEVVDIVTTYADEEDDADPFHPHYDPRALAGMVYPPHLRI